MKKRNRNILVVVAIFLIVIILSNNGFKLPFSIIPSFDISSWQISFDSSSQTLECKNQDAEFELITENLIPTNTGGFLLSKTPIKTICGEVGGIYDKETNTIFTGAKYGTDIITVYSPLDSTLSFITGLPYIIPFPNAPYYIGFKPLNNINIIGMKNFRSKRQVIGPYTLQDTGSFDNIKKNLDGLWLAEYSMNFIMEEDQIIDATYSFTGNVNKCLFSGDNCAFGKSVNLYADKIYFLRGCNPSVSQDCEDYGFKYYYNNWYWLSFSKSLPSDPIIESPYFKGNSYILESVDFIKEQYFQESFTVKYTIPREIISENLHYRKYSCPLLQDYMLVTETFDANSIITKDSFRYAPNYFCSRHPVIITDANTGKTDVNINWYQDIVSGKSITCPVGDTCTFFYVVTNRLELPVICETGSYDVTTGKCVAKPGIVHVCSEGQFDPSTGLCVVQPDSSIVCEIGRYDVTQGKCIWNPPEAIICPVGEYSPIEQACIVYPEQKMVCPIDYEYKNGLCMFYPAEHIICDRGIYEVGLNACVYNPDFLAKCSIGNYDSIQDKCIYTPEIYAQCEKGTFDSVSGKCVFNPDITTGCIQGQYDPVRNACVVTPDLSYLCLNGYYNEELEVCVIFPIEKIYCDEGFVYDSVTDLCVKSPSESIDCPSNYLYDVVRDLCYFTPQTGVKCPDGTTYNQAQDRCEYEPQIGIVCPASTVYDSMEDKCVIHPENRIICNDGYIYDFTLDVCIKRPAIINWWYEFIEWLNNLFK